MTIIQFFLLALPTSLKILYDLYQIKVRKKPISHRSEIRKFVALGVVVSLINAFLMTEYQFWVRFLQSAFLSSSIFFQFFDYLMGLALHGKILYESTASDGSKTDSFMDNLGPFVTIPLRLWYSALGYGLYFQLALTQFSFLK